MDDITRLEEKLRELEKAIEETKKRLPAHSVKPPVMMDLLELEDQYDGLLQEIENIRRRK